MVIMDPIGKENKLKETSEQNCFFNGLSIKINEILENNTYDILNGKDDGVTQPVKNEKIGILHYIIFISLLLYLIYLFC